jgi:predicted metal-dependent HD superfamily phosphohydrolase
MSTSSYTFIKLRRKALDMLLNGLSPQLTYHGIHHTLDVLEVCKQYLRREKIIGYEAHILKLAAAFHDVGFIKTYKQHEEAGCEISAKLMKEAGFDQAEIERVWRLIMATKVPQKPNNLLEQILCDADLDYLGREDFLPISQSLFVELKNHNLISNLKEWNKLQVRFLEKHYYHTAYALKYRQKKKELQLARIKQELSGC